MKRRGRGVCLAALILAAGLFAGCGTAGSDNAAESGQVSGTAAAENKETAPAASTKAEEAATPEVTEEPAKPAASMQEIYDAVAAGTELPNMFFADDDFLMDYYGIDASLLEEYIFASPEDSARVDSVILMKLKDPAEADVISAGLDGLLAQMEVEMDNYLPEAHELVTQAKVRQHGDVLELVISADRDKICGIIDRLLP